MNASMVLFLEKIKQQWKIIALAGAGIIMIVILVLIVLSRQAIMPNQQYIVSDINTIPEADIALVFGGGMEADGSQSTMQEARVKTGVDLYKKGKVKKLMMTGDDGSVRFNEIDAMVYHARTLGVPVYDILTDPHGYRTYESCYREFNVYHLERVIAVSQAFHLPRIIYFCRYFGIETTGFAADYQGYSLDTKMSLRELLARIKGWWQVEVTQPLPRVPS